jgi:hypothetical protein
MTGTAFMAKKQKTKPTIAGVPWDFGPVVLAALGDVPAMVAAFRDYLKRNPGQRATIFAHPAPGETDKQRAARERRATDTVSRWMHGAGFAVHNEEVKQLDDRGRVVNPNGVRRAVRLSVAELYARRGQITRRQADAAAVLIRAYEANFRTAPAIKKVQVDTFPKPDEHIAILTDRASKYHAVARMVPAKARAYVMHVARDDRHITAMPGYRSAYMDRLREGLEGLATALGLPD